MHHLRLFVRSSLIALVVAMLCASAFTGCKADAPEEAKTETAKETKKDGDKADSKKGGDKAEAKAKTPAKADKKEEKKAPSKADGDSITFTKKNPVKGNTRSEAMNMDMNMSINIKMGGKTVKDSSTKNTKIEKKKYEVIAADEKTGLITEAKLTYIELKETKAEDKKPAKVTEKPIVGKTYLLSLEKGALVVKDEQGKPAPPNEASEVKSNNKSFGKPDPFDKLIPEGPIAVGQKIDIPEEFLKELMDQSDDDQVKVTDAKMTLKEVKEINGVKSGVFDTSISVGVSLQKMMKMDFVLKGTIAIAVDSSWPVQISLKGPIKMGSPATGDQGGPQMEIDGSGEMKMMINNTYN